MKNHISVPTDYAVTREQKRFIAKRLMREAGKKKFCKHAYHDLVGPNGIHIQVRDPSYFASHWRDYAERRSK